MIRRPPRSTLFPTRRSSDLDIARIHAPIGLPIGAVSPSEIADGDTRSEEHTSELQSHVNLVCRLLLEKKKNKSYWATPPHWPYKNRPTERSLTMAFRLVVTA